MRRGLDLSAARESIDRLLVRLPPEQAEEVRRRLRRLRHPARLGSLRRTSPLGRNFGYERGTPVDRWYIERFLRNHRAQIRGRVLEVKDSGYTERFGTAVSGKDVLDVDPGNRLATVVADLAAADTIPERSFDCFILTQTLQFIEDTRSAVAHAHRILKPEGALLVTVPVVSPIIDDETLTDYWRFTPSSCSVIFGRVFGADAVRVRTHGNVLASIAFLAGMASEELTQAELETHDSRFALLVSVSAVKT